MLTSIDTARAPTFLDIHRGFVTENRLLAYPFKDVVTYQQMKSHPSTVTALSQLECIADTLLGPKRTEEFENFVGSNILQYCINQPMIVRKLEGYTHEESVRLMLLDLRDFTNFIAHRDDYDRRQIKWIPRFHNDSKIYATNIAPPYLDKPPLAYQDKEWAVNRFETIVPGITLELAETMGFITKEGGWLFPNGEHFQYLNLQD